jgi:hypothetical protein
LANDDPGPDSGSLLILYNHNLENRIPGKGVIIGDLYSADPRGKDGFRVRVKEDMDVDGSLNVGGDGKTASLCLNDDCVTDLSGTGGGWRSASECYYEDSIITSSAEYAWCDPGYYMAGYLKVPRLNIDRIRCCPL